jgi:hypothetical protein
VHLLLKTIIEHWGDLWKNLCNRLLPSLEEIQKKSAQATLMAVNQYVQGIMQQSQMTGLPPQFDVQQLLPLVQQLVKLTATPPTEEEVKAAEKQGANVQ